MAVPAVVVWIGTALLAALLAWVLGSYVRGHRRRELLRRIPGPAGWPLLGNLLALGTARRHEVMRAWADEFGGVYKYSVLGHTVVVVSDPWAARQVLGQGKDGFPKCRKAYETLDQLVDRQKTPNLATGPSDAYWRAGRRCLLHSFTPPQLALVAEVAAAKARSLAEVLVGMGPGVVVDVADMAARYSLDVLGTSQLGYDFQAVEARGEVLLLRLLQEAADEWEVRRRWPLRWLAPWFSDSAAEAQQRFKILAAFVHELWSEVERHGPVAEANLGLSAQLRRMRDPFTAQPLDSELLAAEAGGLLLQGYAPVAQALAWALSCLASHQTEQAKLLAELRREGILQSPSGLSPASLARLEYLDCVLRECLRLHPTGLALASTTRVAPREAPVGRFRVPPGVVVAVDFYSMHRSSRLWKDPARFNPERWVQAAAAAAKSAAAAATAGAASSSHGEAAANGKQQPVPAYDGFSTVEGVDGSGNADAVASAAAEGPLGSCSTQEEGGCSGAPAEPLLCCPEAFAPFGFGARSCIGQHMALLELKVALAVLVGHFRFELATEDAGVYEALSGLVLAPPAGTPLQVTPRSLPTAAGGSGAW